MHPVLGMYFGFEYSIAVKVFMVGFAALALLAALLIRISFTQWIIAAILFFNCLTAPVNVDRSGYIPTWLLPVQMQRAPAHLALGMLLMLIVLVTGRIQTNRVSIQGLLLFAVNVYGGLLMFIHDTPANAAQSLGFALATVPGMIFACSSECQNHEGCLKTLRATMWVSVIWTVCCSVQFVINPRYLVNGEGGRFWGMTANAQGAAMICGPFAVIALWLCLNDNKRRLKLLWIALLGINLLFLGWTASRTGLVALVLGAAFVLYRRIGRVILFLPVLVLVTIGLSVLADELQIGKNLERIVSSDNTREGVWNRQIEKIMESPIIGVGWNETNASESSYLAGFAYFGIGMFGIIMFMLLFSIWKCARFTVLRHQLPKDQRALVDIFCAWNAMFFGAAVFEGFIVARSAPTSTMMFMFAGVGVYLTEAIESRRRHAVIEDGQVDEETTRQPADPEIGAAYGYT